MTSMEIYQEVDLPFIGRENEIKFFTNLLKKKFGHRHFYGISGIGKTTLLKKFIKVANEEGSNAHGLSHPIAIYIDLRNRLDPLSLIEETIELMCLDAQRKSIDLLSGAQEIKVEIAELKKRLTPQITQSITASEGSSISNVNQTISLSGIKHHVTQEAITLFLNWLNRVSTTTTICFIFDTTEQTSIEVKEFLDALISRCGESLILITASRYPWGKNPYPLSFIHDSIVSKELLERPLIVDGKSITIPIKEHASILKLAQGHGLSLKLILSYLLLSDVKNDFLFHSVKSNTDPGSIFRAKGFWGTLLNEIKRNVEIATDETQAIRFQRIHFLLKYGPSLYSFDLDIAESAFKVIPGYKTLFPAREDIKKSLEDPMVALHLYKSSRSLRFHDLIREVGDIYLFEVEPFSYVDLHRKATEFYIDQLLNLEPDIDQLDSNSDWLDRPLKGLDIPIKFKTLRWDKKKRGHIQSLWPSINWYRLYSPEPGFEKWRNIVLALSSHCIRFSNWLGASLIDDLFFQGTSRRETPFYNQLISNSMSCPLDSKKVESWLSFMYEVYKEPNQQDVLDAKTVEIFEDMLTQSHEEVSVPIKCWLIHWLLKCFEKSQNHQKLNALVNYALNLNNLIEDDQRSGFWRAIGDTVIASGQKDRGIDILIKALHASEDTEERAITSLRIGIELGHNVEKIGDSFKYLEMSNQYWTVLEDKTRQGEVQIAMGDLSKKRQSDPSRTSSHFAKAIVLLDEAFEAKKGSVGVLHPGSLLALALINGARADLAVTNFEAAIEKLTRLSHVADFLTSERRYKLIKPLFVSGDLLERQGNFYEAKRIFLQINANARDNGDLRYTLLSNIRIKTISSHLGQAISNDLESENLALAMILQNSDLDWWENLSRSINHF